MSAPRRLPRAAAALLCGLPAAAAVAGPEGAGDAARGAALLVELRCVACHAPPPELASQLPLLPGPALDGVGARARRAWLAQHLADPGPRMPDLLGGLAARERAAARGDLLELLAARGGPFPAVEACADAALLERGRDLYHSVGCVACHAPLELPADLEQPLWAFSGAAPGADAGAPLGPRALDGLPDKTGPEALARFLLDPLSVRPAGEMPSLALAPDEARALGAYLASPDVRLGAPGFALAPGLLAETFEADDPARLEGLAPVRADVVPDLGALPPHREQRFAVRFRGFVDVPAPGPWRFGTASDDGSSLLVDGAPVVENGGEHPRAERTGEVVLSAGRHALEVRYDQLEGGVVFEVFWSGPGVERGPLPAAALSHWEPRSPPRAADPAPDAGRAAGGAEAFERLRCGACHAASGLSTGAPAQPLAALDPQAARGCLGPAPGPGVPRYAFADGARADLAAALRALDPAAPPDPAAELERTLARLDCRACHARGGSGGPEAERALYFKVAGDIDLGDEGRLPPALDGVGFKLKPAALVAVLVRGEGVRPYMLTRMPRFGPANVGHLPALFGALDARPSPPEPAFDPRDVELGRELGGRASLGCIQCHDLAGHEGLGIPAADLARTHDRLSYGWFRELLLDPPSVGMSSRMPFFFASGASPAVDVYGGDPARQVDALWTWLSLGAALPLPDGLDVAADEYELVPRDRVLTAGVFFAGASARSLVVGFPARVHYAFDVEHSRLVAAWKGRFFNAEGTWHGRAGQLERPMGDEALSFPPAPAFARVGRDDAWPPAPPEKQGPRVLGRGVERDGRPVHRYEVGGVRVAEDVAPLVGAAGTGLARRFRFEGGEPAGLVLRAAVGRSVEQRAGELVVDGRLHVRAPDAYAADGTEGREVRVPVQGRALEVDLLW